ncbi:MAG: TonB-dependent receptor [Acidobacteria bacterium]|nr:TonB-dependent receptor [Acidobacteriota bacterium]
MRPIVAGLCALGALCVATQAGLGQSRNPLADLDLEKLAQIPIVSAARHEQSRMGSPRSVSVVTSEEIRRRNFRTVPEAVGSVAGVYLQETNYAGGSPIVRGMVGNRILLLINGIRLNNGMYRLGPNQYLNQIDIDQVDRIEVVRGAGSVLYGSDAFGAVINVITRQAPDPRSGKEFSGAARVRFGTANASGVGRADIAGADGRIGFYGGFSESRFGDLHAGGNRGVQPFTGYRQSAGDLTMAVALGPARTLTAGVSRLKQYDVPRTDVLLEGSDLKYLWHGQGRDMTYVRYEQAGSRKFAEGLVATVAFSRPFEDVMRIQASAPTVERFLSDHVNTATFGLQLTARAGTAHAFTYGLDASSDWVGSTRSDLDLRNGIFSAKPGNYVDGSTFRGFGGFVQDEVRISNRLDAVFGLRADSFHLDTEPRDAATGVVKVHSASSAVTGSGFLLWKLDRRVSLVGGISQGFRAPNLDDSSMLGSSGLRFEIPNAGLNPERSVNLESGIRFQGKVGSLSVVYFHDRYHDLIDRAPALYNGLPFLDRNANGKREANEELVYQRQNISRARVKGIEAETMVNLAENWTWTHHMTWTYGTDVSLAQPLTRIPPFYGASRLTWQPRGLFWAEAALLAATGQHRLSAADMADIRIGPNGTAGYAVVHLRAGLRGTILSGLSVALENVTNRRYRMHGSGFAAPGINLIVGYERPF